MCWSGLACCLCLQFSLVRSRNSDVRSHAAGAVRSGEVVGRPHSVNSSQVMTGIAVGGLISGLNSQPAQRRTHATRRPISNTPSVHTMVSDTDQVDPIDFEEHYSQYSERDQLSRVLTFPDDDIEVNLVQRKIRTEQHVIPEEPYENLDPAVQNCVDCYTSDWVVVNRKYQQYSTSQRQVETREERLRGLANHQYECDSASQEVTPQDQVRKLLHLVICLLHQSSSSHCER